MVRYFHEDLKSRWFAVDVVEGFIVIVVWFVLLLGEFFHPSVPFLFYVVEGFVYLFLSLPLFASVVVLFLPLSLVLFDSSVRR